jgi:hypothetical protein
MAYHYARILQLFSDFDPISTFCVVPPGGWEYFLSQTELRILSDAMLRVATALIALSSFFSAPLASAVCMDCCNRSVEHQLPLCHDNTHTHLGPHVHHVNHVNHVHMIRQEMEASIVIQQCDHQLQDSRLSCHSAACLSARPVQASVASTPGHELQIPSPLLGSIIGSSLQMATPERPPDICRTAIAPPASASAPLRI